MSEFNVGDKVIVVGNEARFGMTKEMRNGVGVVSVSPGRDGYYGVTLDTGYFVSAKPENIYYHVEVTVYTTPPSEITLNGATYVIKEEPNPEHEWKFGDIATHPDYGVGMVFSESDGENDVRFAHNNDWDFVNIKELTFIRRADLSV